MKNFYATLMAMTIALGLNAQNLYLKDILHITNWQNLISSEEVMWSITLTSDEPAEDWDFDAEVIPSEGESYYEVCDAYGTQIAKESFSEGLLEEINDCIDFGSFLFEPVDIQVAASANIKHGGIYKLRNVFGFMECDSVQEVVIEEAPKATAEIKDLEDSKRGIVVNYTTGYPWKIEDFKDAVATISIVSAENGTTVKTTEFPLVFDTERPLIAGVCECICEINNLLPAGDYTLVGSCTVPDLFSFTLPLHVDGDATGIEHLAVSAPSAPVFDLLGRQNLTASGLHIQHGRIVVIK